MPGSVADAKSILPKRASASWLLLIDIRPMSYNRSLAVEIGRADQKDSAFRSFPGDFQEKRCVDIFDIKLANGVSSARAAPSSRPIRCR
jgi:hypothetical protein